MRIDALPIGLYDENSYILHDHDHVLFVDPGRYADYLIQHVNEDSEQVDGIVLTHGHEDHTGAVDDLAEHYHCPVYLHPLDRILVTPGKGNPYGYAAPVYSEITDLKEGKMQIGTFPLEIIHTPGHTKGSVIIRYRNVLFTGDTLFAGDIGRTDLFGGSESEMSESLKKISQLPNDLRVLPGHGPSSTIGQEKQTNYYLIRQRASL